MTKTIMNSILSVIASIDTPEAEEIRQALNAELAKGEAKKLANAEAYEKALPVILSALSDTPVTMGELYEEIKGDLPSDFTKGKVQYAMTHLLTDKVTKIEGKVNSYTLKA